jgi:predicted RND superfamily exporter protein
MGMSIDANVLIFERIKDELRNGVNLLSAINIGYEKAFSAILDGNVTTFLTGAILFALGQGPVKGFAIVLMIGIACSFFTSVFITRVMVTWMTKKGDKSNGFRGYNGVYAYVVQSVQPAADKGVYTIDVANATMNVRSRAAGGLIQALVKKANIDDRRGRMF